MEEENTNGPILKPCYRPATVEDMIQWLWHDGFYRGVVGYGDWWPIDRSKMQANQPLYPIFRPEEDTTENFVYDGTGSTSEAAKETAHKGYIQTMIRSHKVLIEPAILEVDRQLLKAGVSKEEVHGLTTGAASDVYAKLRRLDEAQRPFQTPERVKFRVVCEHSNVIWLPRDVRLEKKGTLDDLIVLMNSNKLWNYYPHDKSQIKTKDASPGNENIPSLLQNKRKGVCHKVLGYKLIPKDGESTHLARDVSGWSALCDQRDYRWMIAELEKDETKMAAICQESTLDKLNEIQLKGRAMFPEEFRELKPEHLKLEVVAEFVKFLRSWTDNWEDAEDISELMPSYFDWDIL